MTAIFRRPIRSATPLRSARSLGLLVVVLTLCFANAPAPAPAQAAPAAPARYYLNIEHPGKFCAGQKYDILVTPRAERQVTGTVSPRRPCTGRTATRP